MLLNEEEKKKREEEAKSIINMHNIGDTINSINYANLNNMKIQTQNENEQNFINRVNEANNIINSINPRQNVEAPSINEEEMEKSFQATQRLIDLIDSNNEDTLSNNLQQENKKDKNNIDKAQIEQFAEQSKMQKVLPNQNPVNNINFKNTKVSIANSEKTKNVKEISVSDIDESKEAERKNKNIAKGGVDAFNEWADTILNNIKGGVMKAASGLANVATTLAAVGLRGAEGASRIVGLDNIANNFNFAYNSVVEAGNDIKETADYTSNVTSQIDNRILKSSGQIADVISNMAGNAFIGYVTGIPSTVAQGLSVGGSSAQETLDENKDKIVPATITGLTKGYTSYLTEKMFDANILTRGEGSSISSAIDKLISNKLTSKYGKEFANKTVGVVGENLEELVEDNVDNLIDKFVNNKNTPGFFSKEWWDNTTETAKITTLSTIIMSFLGMGGETFENKEKNMQADYWINEAQKIIEQEDMAIHFNSNEVKNINDTEEFYITRFSQDGQLENIVPTRGKVINNPNKELNVTPVVVKDSDTKYYNVIDGNTGVVLDSTYYSDTLEAENSFAEKVNNLSEVQLTDINKKIAESNYSITNEIMNSINQARNQLLQDREINYQAVNTQNNDNAIQSFNDIKKLNEQISDKSIYNKTAAINLFETVSNNIKNIEVSRENGVTYINSLGKDGEITYKQKINSPIYNGSKLKSIINNAINNADLTEINNSNSRNTDTTQQPVNQNTDNLSTKTTSYAPEKVKSIVKPFDSQEEYTVAEMANIWNNEIDKNDLQSIYDDKGNLQGYVAIQEDGDKLVVNSYDSNDNIVTSEVIPSQNGNYTSKAIKDTIEKVTGLYNENETSDMQTNKTNEHKNIINNLKKDIENFSKQVDAVIDGTFPKNDMLTLLSKTPQPLIDIGLTDLPITITQRHLKTIMNSEGTDKNANYHALGIDTVKQLPEAINNPLDIVQSNTRNDSVVLTTYLADNQDRTIIASIKIDGKGSINDVRINTNVMTSAYGRNNYEQFMEKNLQQGNLLYDIDKGVIKKVAGARLQLPRRNNSTTNNDGSSIDTSISQKDTNVKSNTDINNKSTQKAEKNTTKIEDFGEKIGGARKDLEIHTTNINTGKEVIHDYTVNKTDNGYSVNFKGKILKDEFKTQEEAEQYILDFKENIKNNRAFVKENNSMLMTENNKYLIYLRNPRTLKSQYIGKGFNNKTDAENYAIALSMYLKENGKNLFRPQIQKVTRENPNIKNATKTTGENILKNFGFKGGEFGNWVKQNERQQFLNYAQDAFTDLSIALDITPESLGQNGNMNIAFGARGQGLTGAVAHFEPNKKVINMTRLKGAGSLAHEYGHSIDNYLSRVSKYDENGMITTGRKGELSDNLYNAMKNVIDTMKYNISTNQEDINKKNAIYEKGRKNSLNSHLSYLDNVFNGNQTTYKYNRKTKQREQTKIQVTDEQKQRYQDIKNILLDGKLDSKRTFIGNSLSSNNYEYAKPIEDLKNLYKEVVGRKINEDTIYWLYRYGQPSQQVKEVKSESGYWKSSLELDKATGRTNAYFSKTEEMWARAFESYIYDKLKEKGITNTYLVHSVNNNNYALFNPFPAGEERNNINKAFDNLIQTMKSEGLFNSTTINNKSDTNVRSMKTNNTTETNNPDIRYMKKNKSQNVKNEDIHFNKRTAQSKATETTQRNAERQESYIEQEIKKLEETGNWDNSIPVTKLTDIRKTIEDYLGLGIKKGHFRQQAFAIYKGNRDIIRSKELKDIDSILHETGHALDIGNRLKIDKESIADELLTAIDKLGGYEQETRTVRLEEGFAEVIREYSVIPEQAKIDYPQTISVIEKLRQNDKSFNNFITKVHEQTYNYIHQNPRNRTLSNISIGEQTDKTPLSKEWIKQETMRNIWDKDYTLKSAVSTLQKANGKTVNQLKASENAYLLTRLSNGIGDKVSSMLAEGYIDANGNKLMPGLNQIGEILGNDSSRFNDLRAYLVARRDTDYRAKTLKTGLRNNDSLTVIEEFKNDKQIQEASKLIYDTLDGVMKYAVDNNLINAEAVNSLKESNAFYVPMQRVFENKGNQVGRKGAVSEIIKQRTGSELDIKDVLENIIANSSNIIQQVENNNVLKALYKQGEANGLTGAIYDVIDTPMTKIGTAKLETWKTELEKQGVNTENLDLEKTIDLFSPNNKIDAQNLITSFINDDGKRVYLQFNDEILFNSLMNLDKNFMSKVLKITRKWNMPLRYGATMANLGFAIPNMLSDTAQAAIYSTAGFVPIVDNALGVLDILAANNKTVRNFVNQVAPEYADRINKLYTIYQQTGATSSTRMSQYRESTQNLMKNIYGTKKSENLGIKEKYKPLKRLLDILTYIPEISEQSTRFRVFEKNYDYYKNKGNSEMDSRIMAAMESRDATQDFGRTGNLTREINQVIPFSAARVGSAYTFAEKVKANPKQVGMRIALLTTLAMGIKALGYDDDEIEELNQRKKDDNFVLKIGNNIVTIKKPQGILRSVINLAEYIQDLSTGHIEEGKEGERLGEWLNNAIMDNMPADEVTGLVPNLVAPVIENALNKDFYYNTDIVKSYDLELPDSEQYYDYNSQLAIWLGKAFNYSPAKIDNLISGYFAGLGTSITDMMDFILGKTGITTEQPEMGAEDNAVGKRFIVNVNSNSASIDEIYNKKTELTKKKNGGNITDEENAELENITSAISNLSKLNKQIKEIKKDLSLSGKEKADKIKLLQQEKTDTARKALGKNVLYTENEAKIQSTQFYPTNEILKQSGYELTLNTDMKKEYEQLASEYYNKYESQGLYNEEKLKDIKSKAKEYAKSKLFQKYKNNLVKTKK